MTTIALWLGVLTGLGWLAVLAATVRGVLSLPRMDDLEVLARTWPRLWLVRPRPSYSAKRNE